MKKRAFTGYALAGVLPVVAVAVWMLRVVGPASRGVAVVVYGLGVVALVFAVQRHPRSRVAVSRGRKTALA